MTESRLKKSLNAGGRETRGNEDASRAAPEDKFISTQERRNFAGSQPPTATTPLISGFGLGTFPLNRKSYLAMKTIV